MSWDWFEVLWSIAAVFMIINLLWKIAMFPVAFSLLIFNEKFRWVVLFLLMCVPYYFLASFAALTVVGVNHGVSSLLNATVGGTFLFLNGILGATQAKSQAEKDGDYVAYKFANYRYIIVLAGLLYYIYSMYDFKPAVNFFTLWLYEIMQWIQSIPFVGLGISVVAFLNAVYIIFMALLVVFSLIVSIFSKETKSVDL
ncbi:hypothetical protein OB236_23905 [Paenibacillus sp. WQ 127069]|uniref:Uncharacterized protein n=2 Tax=Paenibacillus baimaensis TaxID=2982185 RepID=A0ABT2UM46_9BACL|nr:hypothetical protein [Paenibacillus sp. WQ 127069]